MNPENSTDLTAGNQAFSRAGLILLAATLVLLALLYAWIIYMSSAGDVWWQLDVVNTFRIWGVDDPYRYYIIRDAFNHASYFSWSYTLPLQLLLDGSLSVLFDQNIVALRTIHGALYLGSLYFLARSLARFIPRWPLAVSAVLLLGLIPYCLFVSISFYAEAYMMVFVVLMLVAQMDRRDNLLLVLAAIAPLTRPEGAFFLGAVGLCFLLRRDLQRAVLAGLPFGVYFIWLLATSGWSHFAEWRAEFVLVQHITSEIMPELVDAGNIWRMFGALFLMPVLLSLFHRKIVLLWPLLLATVLWFVFWGQSIIIGKGNYEARYFAPLVPVLVVMWALGMDRLMTLLSGYSGERVRAGVGGLLFVITLFSFVLQQTHLRFYTELLFTEDRIPLAALPELPFKTTPESLASRQLSLRALYHAVSADNPHQVDRLIISSSFAYLFYHLDPEKVPANVMVGFAPTRSRDEIHNLMYKEPNRIFAMFGGEERYAYFDFFPAELGSQLAVFIGHIEYVRPTRTYGDVPLHLFRYQSYQ